LNVTGANGYRLQFGNVDVPVVMYGPATFTPTTAPLTITGTVKQVNGKTSTNPLGSDELKLDGTATGNLISGAIMDAADYPTNPYAQPLRITKAGTGEWILSGTNTYTGNTSITGGTLEIGGAGQLGSGAYAGAIAIAAAKTFKYNSSADQTLSGIIGTAATTGILVKAGPGTLTLTNANIYTGATSITAGKLKIDTAGTINSTSGLTINGATAEFMYNNSTNAFNKPITFTQGTLSGTGKIGVAVTVPAAGTLAPGASLGTLTLGNTTLNNLNDTGKLLFELGMTGGLSDMIVTGQLTLAANLNLADFTFTTGPTFGAGEYTLFQTTGITGAGTVDTTPGMVGGAPVNLDTSGSNIVLNVVPEPATLVLLALGGLGLLLGRKRR